MPLQRQHSYRIGKLVAVAASEPEANERRQQLIINKKGGKIEVLAEPQGIVVNAQCFSAQIFLARAPTNLNRRNDV